MPTNMVEMRPVACSCQSQYSDLFQCLQYTVGAMNIKEIVNDILGICLSRRTFGETPPNLKMK